MRAPRGDLKMRAFALLAASAAMCVAVPAIAKNHKGNGGSNSTPVACNAATDLSIAAISCSGFYSGNVLNNADTAFVRAPVVGERGEIAQRDGATAVPGLFVVGQSWMRSRRSGRA